MKKTTYVTSPLLPDFDEFCARLRDIWQSGILTNNGPILQEFEQQLAARLGVPYVTACTNGTLPLMLALKALGIEQGEVITTPFTFVATSSALKWQGLTPVFADVEAEHGTLDPACIERLITERTAAIMPVHVYGYPCETEQIEDIARRHNLPVIYDAAHAFGVKRNGESILNAGTLSTLSFHATKVFNTIEGGAVVSHDADMKKKLDNLRNFGITGETSVEGPGINAKMDELRAAWGLLNLQKLPQAIDARRKIYEIYKRELANTSGIRIPSLPEDTEYNYSHFPIFVTPDAEALYRGLLAEGVHARRYFYPLVSAHEEYSNGSHTPAAAMLSKQALCLPIYPSLKSEEALRIARIIKKFSR